MLPTLLGMSLWYRWISNSFVTSEFSTFVNGLYLDPRCRPRSHNNCPHPQVQQLLPPIYLEKLLVNPTSKPGSPTTLSSRPLPTWITLGHNIMCIYLLDPWRSALASGRSPTVGAEYLAHRHTDRHIQAWRGWNNPRAQRPQEIRLLISASADPRRSHISHRSWDPPPLLLSHPGRHIWVLTWKSNQ